MPASSLTGMKAPERPPVEEVAMRPPFLTASFSMASAAVVPGAPVRARPIASRISATESPIAGEGASERSMMPIWAPSISAASRRHELADAGDLEGRALDQVGEVGERQVGVAGDHVANDRPAPRCPR